MIQITREITVDVARINEFQAIIAKQSDYNSRFLRVTITNNGCPINIVEGSTVSMNALRPDNASQSFLGTVNEDGTVTVPLTSWMLELDGRVCCDISVIDENLQKLTTTLFTLHVEGAANPDINILQDERYPIIIQLLSELSNIQSKEAARDSAESQRQINETTRCQAEAQRVAAERAREEAEAIRTRSDLTYIHIQSSPSSEWTINHNLQKYPSVSIVDSAGSFVVGDVIYTDINSLRIIFSSGFSGKAYLN